MRFQHPMDFTGTYPTAWAGYRFKELLGYTTGKHTGVDYNFGTGNNDIGRPIYAIADGTVALVENLTSKGYGNTLIINHGEVYSRYMHAQKYTVKVGDKVKRGQVIGTVGNTGTKWAHLHLDIWKSNLGVHTRYDKDTQLQSYVDPYLCIEERKNFVEEELVNQGDVINMYRLLLGREPDAGGLATFTGKSWNSVFYGITGSDEYKSKKANEAKTITDLQTALLNEQKKPPKEIVKEVEKIVTEYVDRPVEVIKEVEKPLSWQRVIQWVREQFKRS